MKFLLTAMALTWWPTCTLAEYTCTHTVIVGPAGGTQVCVVCTDSDTGLTTVVCG